MSKDISSSHDEIYHLLCHVSLHVSLHIHAYNKFQTQPVYMQFTGIFISQGRSGIPCDFDADLW